MKIRVGQPTRFCFTPRLWQKMKRKCFVSKTKFSPYRISIKVLPYFHRSFQHPWNLIFSGNFSHGHKIWELLAHFTPCLHRRDMYTWACQIFTDISMCIAGNFFWIFRLKIPVFVIQLYVLASFQVCCRYPDKHIKGVEDIRINISRVLKILSG